MDDRHPTARVAVRCLLGGLLTAAAASVPAVFLWMGLATAGGLGDPTWNDGEQVWATAAGAVMTLPVLLLSGWVLRLLGREDAGHRRTWAHLLWWGPTVLVEAWAAIAFLG